MTKAAQKQNPENLPAKKKRNITEVVLSKVQVFQQNRELDLPPNYSPSNALKSAWLILQGTVDKNNKPALSVCTKESVANALLDMVVQGLNPAKKQCYFIVYGKKLMLHRSYMGAVAVCKRVSKDLDDIYAEVVYAGDELEFDINRGRRTITIHKQKFANIDDSKIQAAYAVAINKDGEIQRTELMTIDQLKAAWAQSQMKPINQDGSIKKGSTHDKFTAEMAKKTVINRMGKRIINTSADEDLLIQTIRRNDEMHTELDADVEVEEYGNAEVIDINPQIEEKAQEPDPDDDEPEQQAETGPDEEDPDAFMDDEPPY